MATGNNILNYTTSIAAGKTIGQITFLLVAKRASAINIDYVGGKATALTFVIRVGDNMISFRMQPNVEGVRMKLRNRDVAQAERVAWRILLRWVEAQMAMVESTQAELGQVFLPYAVSANGSTMWQVFQVSNNKQLGSGSSE
jgi:hypothetical protein